MPISCSTLMSIFKTHITSLPYANPTPGNVSYGGWVSDLKTYDQTKGKRKLSLDLTKENDLFLLFVLASCWSRTSKYEQSVYFTVYLKEEGKDSPSYWTLSNFIREKGNCASIRRYIQNNYYKFTGRAITINENYFDSAYGIAKYWNGIKDKLSDVENGKASWKDFMIHMNGLSGLAVGCGFDKHGNLRLPGGNDKKMCIKIPLILRELRIQGVSTTIPGEYCCVPDARVCDTAKHAIIGLKGLDKHYTIDDLITASTKIYNEFNVWYDIPLFAYDDLVPLVPGLTPVPKKASKRSKKTAVPSPASSVIKTNQKKAA